MFHGKRGVKVSPGSDAMPNMILTFRYLSANGAGCLEVRCEQPGECNWRHRWVRYEGVEPDVVYLTDVEHDQYNVYFRARGAHPEDWGDVAKVDGGRTITRRAGDLAVWIGREASW